MTLSAKLQPIFIIVAAFIGLLLGYTTKFGNFSVNLIEPFLMMLPYFVFLTVDGKKFKESFKNIRFTVTALIINFIWTPLLAYLLGLIFFNSSVDLQIGLVMLMVTPCTDWYLVFTGIANGNIALGASILPLNLLLQILLLPVYLFLFFGGTVTFDSSAVLISIVTVLIIPFALAMLTKLGIRFGNFFERKIAKLNEIGDNAQTFFLCMAVIAMFASESKEVIENPLLLLQMMVPLVIFYVTNFILAGFVGRKQNFSYEDTVSLTFTTIARNSPLSLAIAVAAFPDHPLISLALVIGPLLELPALSIIATLLKKKAHN
ncbi:bile acid:sodium symporter [Clostridium neonatale]|uniref:arsenic resistance protein n=1 Tax=Clostridium neonatale TaxID=137838 RepID=UPI00291C16B2|nr:bile acid:sodium symporter [Clostridium neonatale]CAI3685978.1 arsenite transporter [Clostridium neonatale]CAI3686943.1 arsenite transporter [Clostridium neonatale]